MHLLRVLNNDAWEFSVHGDEGVLLEEFSDDGELLLEVVEPHVFDYGILFWVILHGWNESFSSPNYVEALLKSWLRKGGLCLSPLLGECCENGCKC